MIKFASWNVNGLRAAMTKGFPAVVEAIDADCFCVQETKLQAGQLDLNLPGYTAYHAHARKKGYSGVAILSRLEPLSWRAGIGSEEHDAEGRAVTLEFPGLWLVSVYAPNSQGMLARIDYRTAWEDRLRAYLTTLAASKPVVLCGDLNVARHDIDLRHPDLYRESTGFSTPERRKLEELIGAGFVDTYRALHPRRERAYTWWSYQGMARSKDDGWRIDYFLVSRALEPRIARAEIYSRIPGSDHCPISLTLS